MSDQQTNRKQRPALVGQRTWIGLLVAAAVLSVVAGAAQGDLTLTLGLAIFFTLVLLPLRMPYETALLILATGWLPIEDLTGAQRDLFAFAGGLNVSGMRLVGGALGLLIAIWALRRPLLSAKWPRWILIGVGAYVLALAWTALTLLWAPDFVEGARGLAKLTFPLLIAAVIAADPYGWGPATLVRRTATVLAATLVASTLYGFAGALEPALLEPSETDPIANWWAWAGAGSYAFFAGIVGILFVALAAHRLMRHAWWIAILALPQMPLALKRLPLGALGVAASWMVAWGGARRYLFPIGAVAAAACLLFFPPLVQTNVYNAEGGDAGKSVDAAREVLTSPGSANQTVRLEGREWLWRMAINRMEGGDWVHGKGMNAWAVEAQAAADAGRPLTGGAETQLHGEPVRLLFELGIVGTALIVLPFLILTGYFAIVCVRAKRYTLERGLSEAAIGVIAFYVLCWITDNTLDYYLVGAYAWTVIALAARVVGHRPDDDTPSDDATPSLAEERDVGPVRQPVGAAPTA